MDFIFDDDNNIFAHDSQAIDAGLQMLNYFAVNDIDPRTVDISVRGRKIGNLKELLAGWGMMDQIMEDVDEAEEDEEEDVDEDFECEFDDEEMVDTEAIMDSLRQQLMMRQQPYIISYITDKVDMRMLNGAMANRVVVGASGTFDDTICLLVSMITSCANNFHVRPTDVMGAIVPHFLEGR